MDKIFRYVTVRLGCHNYGRGAIFAKSAALISLKVNQNDKKIVPIKGKSLNLECRSKFKEIKFIESFIFCTQKSKDEFFSGENFRIQLPRFPFLLS